MIYHETARPDPPLQGDYLPTVIYFYSRLFYNTQGPKLGIDDHDSRKVRAVARLIGQYGTGLLRRAGVIEIVQTLPFERRDMTLLAGPFVSTGANPFVLCLRGSWSDFGGPWLDALGLTSEGEYKTEVWYPEDSAMKGAPYEHLVPIGKTDAMGRVPNWNMDPLRTADGTPDPNGTYRFRFTDLATGRVVDRGSWNLPDINWRRDHPMRWLLRG